MGSGQVYLERLPEAALDALVRTVWIQRIGPEPYRQRNLPTGGLELHCPVGSLPRLVGPLTGPSVDMLAPGTTLVGVRFRPGVAAAVFGLPASELVDLTLGLDLVWGPAAVDLGEWVAAAGAPEAALRVVQDWLVARRVEPPDPLVSEVVRRSMPGRADLVATLADQLGISGSQLRRAAWRRWGLGPRRCSGPCASRASWRSPRLRACDGRRRTTAAWPGWPPRPATSTTPT